MFMDQCVQGSPNKLVKKEHSITLVEPLVELSVRRSSPFQAYSNEVEVGPASEAICKCMASRTWMFR